MRPCRVTSSIVVAPFHLVLALGLVAVGSMWNTAHAQAWIGDKGSLDVSLDYNLGVSDKIIRDGGQSDLPDAGTTTQEFTLGGEYVPLRKLAVAVALPI